jgi:lipoate-protein ligase A
VADGRKLIGSAQWRDGEALLQHGSLLLHNEQAVVEDLRIGGPGSVAVPAAGLAEFLDPLPEDETISQVLANSFATEFGRDATREELTPTERAAAEEARTKYEDDAWTWRR